MNRKHPSLDTHRQLRDINCRLEVDCAAQVTSPCCADSVQHAFPVKGASLSKSEPEDTGSRLQQLASHPCHKNKAVGSPPNHNQVTKIERKQKKGKENKKELSLLTSRLTTLKTCAAFMFLVKNHFLMAVQHSSNFVLFLPVEKQRRAAVVGTWTERIMN